MHQWRACRARRQVLHADPLLHQAAQRAVVTVACASRRNLPGERTRSPDQRDILLSQIFLLRLLQLLLLLLLLLLRLWGWWRLWRRHHHLMIRLWAPPRPTEQHYVALQSENTAHHHEPGQQQHREEPPGEIVFFLHVLRAVLRANRRTHTAHLHRRPRTDCSSSKNGYGENRCLGGGCTTLGRGLHSARRSRAWMGRRRYPL